MRLVGSLADVPSRLIHAFAIQHSIGAVYLSSFDQYFVTYPHAANLPGETPFRATDDTPRVNGLLTAGLLEANPNSSQPQRLSPADAIVCSDSLDYTDEQNAFDHGPMDMFPERTASSGCPLGQVVDYFDGNTLTALWNYAQHFAMSDNSFNALTGPGLLRRQYG